MRAGGHLPPCAERAVPGRTSLNSGPLLPPREAASPGIAGQHATGFALCPSLWMNSFHLGASREKQGERSPGQHRAGLSLSGACGVAAKSPFASCTARPSSWFHLPPWRTPRSEVLAKAGEPENVTTANVKEVPATARSEATVRTGTRPPDLHRQQKSRQAGSCLTFSRLPSYSVCCAQSYQLKRSGRSWARQREEQARRGYGYVAVHFSPEVWSFGAQVFCSVFQRRKSHWMVLWRQFAVMAETCKNREEAKEGISCPVGFVEAQLRM
ncbi:uncharacterized protein LOC135294111 isoform X2 [Passer domesticus]|uniref:uncharacterized protein LOC135294111 isoform X2 n=1 Tax=Passer domesticus TaxID=48849 RepID=UPI0030FECB14